LEQVVGIESRERPEFMTSPATAQH
jgi:hypothetical protein